MAIVGSATVVMRAVTTKLQSDIQRGLQAAAPAVRSAGSNAGQAFRSGFSRAGQVDFRQSFNSARTSARNAGTQAGQMFGRVFSRISSSSVTRGLGSTIQAAGGMGGRVGNAFSSGFGRSGASRVFTKIGLRIAALVPILGALVGAISNVVSGLFAIGAAAASAAQSLVVLPSLLTAIVQGGAVMLASFSGLGDALGAGLESARASGTKAATDVAEAASDAGEAVSDAAKAVKDAEENAARSIRDAIRGVADARRNLAETYRNAADAQKAAIEAVSDAEKAQVQALENVKDAQEALNDAREEAKERLIDLQFASQSGALAERRAAMDLADARWELNASSELPVDNRLRMEAQLSYEEALLNLQMIKEQNGDVAKEQKEAKKQGVEGSDAVRDAQDQLKDAQEDLRESVEAVTDALENQRRTAADNARAVADAQRNLADAERNVKDAREDGTESIADAKEALDDARKAQGDANAAMAAGSAEALKYQTELDKLSPPARRFVQYLVSLRDDLGRLREAGQRGLFPGLQTSIQTVVDGLFPTLERVMFKTGKSVAKATQSIANDLTSGPFVGSFGRVTDQNAKTIERMGNVVGDLTRSFFALLDGSRPLINRFTKWFEMWADGNRKTLEAKNRTGELTKTMNRAGNRMTVIIDIVKNLAEGFFDMGKIGDNQGMRLLRVFRDTTEEFANFTDKVENRKKLKDFFKQTADNFLAISSLVKEVGAAFFRLGANPAIGQIAKALEPVVASIEKLVTTMLEDSGTEIISFVQSIIDAFQGLSESGSLNIFLGILTGFFRALTATLGAPIIGEIIKSLLAISAALYAISIIRKFPGVSLLSRGLGALFAQNADGVRGFTRLRTAIAGIPSRAAQLARDIKFQIQYRLLLLKERLATIRATAARLASAAATKISSAATKVWNALTRSSIVLAVRQKVVAIASAIAAKAVAAATKAWAIAQALLNAAMKLNPIGLIIAGIVALGAIIVLCYRRFEGFRKVVDTVFGAVGKALKWVWDLFKGFWDDMFGHSIIPDMMKGFEGFGALIGKVFDAIGKVVKVLAKVFTWLWENVVKPAFKGISFVVNLYIKLVVGYIKAWIGFFKNVLAPVFTWLWNKVVKPAFAGIVKVVRTYIATVRRVLGTIIAFMRDRVAPVVRALWSKVVKPAFSRIADFVRSSWNKVIKPALRAFWKFINGVLIPIIKFLWTKVVKTYFTSIYKLVKFAWDKVIKPALSAMWKFIDKTLIPVLKGLWNNVVKPVFNSIGSKVRQIWKDFISPAFTSIKKFIDDKLIPAFNSVKTGVTNMWNKIRDAAKAPIEFVVNTVWNNGLRKMLNYIPGVEIDPYTVNFAKGGILPGYTPGRDVHSFYSPTAGGLNLSGGEAIMRPEWTRAMGPRAIGYLNEAAARGGSALKTAISQVNNDGRKGDLGAYAAGGILSATRMQAAASFAREQAGEPYGWGSVGPSAWDCSGFMSAITNVLQGQNPYTRRGTTGTFPWGGFAPGPGQFTIGSTPNYDNTGTGHMAGTLGSMNVESRGGTGVLLGGAARGYGDSGFSQVYHLGSAGASTNGGGGNAGPDPRVVEAREDKRGWLDLIGDIRSVISNVRSSVNTMADRVGSNEWYSYAVKAGKGAASEAVQHINDKIPDKIVIKGPIPDLDLPNNPIKNPFDEGGVSTSKGWMPKNTSLPERVLSPRQTQSFERLVEILDSKGPGVAEGPVHLTVNVPHEASPRDVIDGIVYELRRMGRGGRYNR